MTNLEILRALSKLLVKVDPASGAYAPLLDSLSLISKLPSDAVAPVASLPQLPLDLNPEATFA